VVLQCAVCGTALQGSYFLHQHQPLCEEDYKVFEYCGTLQYVSVWRAKRESKMSSDVQTIIILLYFQAATAKVCCECGLRLTGVYYTREDGSVVCEQDWRAGLPSCPACSRPVEGNLVKLSNSSYHPTCFTCCQCAAPLAGLPFHLAGPGRALHCAGCYARKHAAVCSACQRPVLPEPGSNTAQRLRALGRDFHPDCFRCQVPGVSALYFTPCLQDCSRVLDSRVAGSECYPDNNQPYCYSCCAKRVRSKSNTARA